MNRKGWIALGLALLVGCGASQNAASQGYYSADSAAYETGYGLAENGVYEEAKAEEPAASMSETDQIKSQEKLVYTGSMSIETLNYDEASKALREHINRYLGIIEYENERDNAYNWYYSNYEKNRGTKVLEMNVRIPTEHFQDFLNDIEGTGKVLSRSTNVENITRQYYSTATEIESLQIQQKRLLAMMEEATTIEEMLLIEERLSEVETDLKIYQNDLNRMDTDVAYSTVRISLSEVMSYTPETEGMQTSRFFYRLGETAKWAGTFFVYILQQLVLWFIRLLPIAIIGGVLSWIFSKLQRKGLLKIKLPSFKRKKKEEPKE